MLHILHTSITITMKKLSHSRRHTPITPWKWLSGLVLVVLGLAGCKNKDATVQQKIEAVVDTIGMEEDLYGGPVPGYYEEPDSIIEEATTE